MSNKKVLFVAPRFHTNQFFLTKNLIEKDVIVNFLAVYLGGSENHKYLTPILSKPSFLIKWFLKNRSAKDTKGRKYLRLYHITSFSQCIKLYKDLKPDIIIIRNMRFFISIQHLIIGLLLRKKVYLYTLFGLRQKISYSRRLFYNFMKLLGVKHYTSVIGDETQPILPNTIYIPMIFEKLVTDESIKEKIKNKGIQIITVGKMQKRKNLKQLIESLYRIDFFEDINNVLIIVSECISDENREILNDIKKTITKNHSQIKLMLNVEHQNVFKLLQRADLFVMPSHNEPAGTSMVEAMACGLPVICSNSNGAKCYIEDNMNGFIYEHSENLDNLDPVLKGVLKKNKLIKFGLESLNIIEKNHSIQYYYDKIIK